LRLGQSPLAAGAIGQGGAVLAMTFLMAQTACLIFGLPVWIMLRLLRRESGFAYGGSGLLLGFCLAVAVLSSWQRPNLQIWLVICRISLVTCAAAGGFWCVARKPTPTVPGGTIWRAGQ
jgi:hypothetical protein